MGLNTFVNSGWSKIEIFFYNAVKHTKMLRTKLKWILNENTYRVAVVTKVGVLQVKSVIDSQPELHENSCKYKYGCEVYNGFRMCFPLKKTFFPCKNDWFDSLPETGHVVVTEPKISDSKFEMLCSAPLTANSDSLKLKELEERFPGATFILTTPDKNYVNKKYVVKYVYQDLYADPSINHMIMDESTNLVYLDFKGLGTKEKPDLTAGWHGRFIDLSHLL